MIKLYLLNPIYLFENKKHLRQYQIIVYSCIFEVSKMNRRIFCPVHPNLSSIILRPTTIKKIQSISTICILLEFNYTCTTSKINDNIQTDNYIFPSNISRRCLVEDFMISTIGTNVMILVPAKYSKGKWYDCDNKIKYDCDNKMME